MPPISVLEQGAQRAQELEERLTQQHLAIDGVAVGDGAGRVARRELSQRTDELCARLDALRLKGGFKEEQGEP